MFYTFAQITYKFHRLTLMKNKFTFFLWATLLWSLQGHAQNNLQGTVYDANTSEPLTGATVSIKNTQIGTVTDFDGNFTLGHGETYPLEVQVSYLGFETQVFRLAGYQLLKIYLAPSRTALNEIIVTSRRRSEAVQQIPIPIAV